MSEPLHRDDMDPEMLQALEQQFQELYPGYKVVFSGDAPMDSEAARKDAEVRELIDRKSHESLARGTCFDCGAQMPDYTPEQEDWQPAQGWRHFNDFKTGEITAWQCPACDAQDEDGQVRPLS